MDYPFFCRTMTASTLYQRLGTLKCDINEDGMQINANFNQRVLIHSDNEPWLASPMPGVERRMLDRIGDEVAQATTIVRYVPNSPFSKHSTLVERNSLFLMASSKTSMATTLLAPMSVTHPPRATPPGPTRAVSSSLNYGSLTCRAETNFI